jgi:S-adenosylmethionine decarboxylase
LNSTVRRACRYARDSASLPDADHGARSFLRDLDGSPTTSTLLGILPDRVIVHAVFTRDNLPPMHGIEWVIDAHGCAPERLRDRETVVALLDRIVAAMRLHVVSTAVHVFGGHGGVTALYLLAESHLTIHTFPETGTATLNAYCCTPRAPAAWRALLGDTLGAREVAVRELARGEASAR